MAEHGIYVSNSGDRPVIRRNHVYGIHMNGDLSQGGDGVISEAVVEANVIHGDGVQSSRIVNNVLYDNHASGISLYRIDGGQPARNNLVAHNTIVQAADGRWAVNIQNASTGNRVVNNILVTLHSFRGAVAASPDSLPGFVSDANAVTPRFTLDGGSSVLGLAAWQAGTGQDGQTFASTPDALFADAAAGDYHLRADSHARDAALVPTDVTTDFEDRPRPIGPAADIGADEHGTVAPPVPPANLVVNARSNPPATVARGGRFVVTDTVRNQGGTASGASVTRYVLLGAPLRSRGDRLPPNLLGPALAPGDHLLQNRRPVPALAAGTGSTGGVSVSVPSGIPPGTYFLLACADYASAVAESSETNNCRAATTSVRVR